MIMNIVEQVVENYIEQYGTDSGIQQINSDVTIAINKVKALRLIKFDPRLPEGEKYNKLLASLVSGMANSEKLGVFYTHAMVSELRISQIALLEVANRALIQLAQELDTALPWYRRWAGKTHYSTIMGALYPEG